MTDNDVAILGVGHSEFGKLEDQLITDFGPRAAREAIVNSNVDTDEIDEAYMGNVGGAAQSQTSMVGHAILKNVGVTAIPITRVENACASSASAFREAFQSIKTGEQDIVMALGAEKLTGIPTEEAIKDMSGASDAEVEGPMGLTFMGMYGMKANAYMNRFGDIREELADIAVKNHSNGLLNPYAHFHMDIDRDDVLDSEMIADPIRLLDACPLSDGAAAVLLARGEKAEDLVENPIYVDAVEASTSHFLDSESELWKASIERRVSERAYKEAGIGADDIDVAEVHDAATIGELFRYEGLGIAGFGEGPSLIRNGETEIGGRIPVNPSGGLKARGHPIGATGTAQICELVWQLRGEAGDRQVDEPSIGVALNGGGALRGKTGTMTVSIVSKH